MNDNLTPPQSPEAGAPPAEAGRAPNRRRTRRALALAIAATCVAVGAVVVSVNRPVTGGVQPAVRGSSWAAPAAASARIAVTTFARGSSWS